MHTFFFTVTLVLFSLILLPVSTAQAAESCTIIYGGGEIECEATVSATAKPTATPTQRANQQGSAGTTKGGLPVHEPTNATTTPETGPEMLGLATLIPAAGLGYYLRRKTK